MILVLIIILRALGKVNWQNVGTYIYHSDSTVAKRQGTAK